MATVDVKPCKLSALKLALPFDLWVQLKRACQSRTGCNCLARRNFLRGSSRDLAGRNRFSLCELLDTPQISRLRIRSVCGAYFPRAPRARETCQERGQVLIFGRRREGFVTTCKHDQMALHCPHFLQQLQRVKCVSYLTKLCLGGVGHRFGAQQPFARGLRWMIALGDLRSLTMLFGELEGGLKEVHK